jgi:hypothetical protein
LAQLQNAVGAWRVGNRDLGGERGSGHAVRIVRFVQNVRIEIGAFGEVDGFGRKRDAELTGVIDRLFPHHGDLRARIERRGFVARGASGR